MRQFVSICVKFEEKEKIFIQFVIIVFFDRTKAIIRQNWCFADKKHIFVRAVRFAILGHEKRTRAPIVAASAIYESFAGVSPDSAGQISAETRLGAPAASYKTHHAEEEGRMEDRVRILVVDDNAVMRSRIYEAMSAQERVECCHCVSGGTQAVDRLREGNYNVLILDLILSGIDGFTVLETASRLPEPPRMIVISALAQDSIIRKACNMGAYFYFLKPFSMESLVSRALEPTAGTSLPERGVLRMPLPAPPVKSLDERIANIFLSVGIPAHIKGYHFLREAVKLVYAKRTLINAITKQLYPAVAEVFDTSPSKVERAIRHAIEVAWSRGKIENINTIFGYTIYSKQEKPTNGEFIALIADKLLMDDLTRSEQSKAM